MFNAKDKEINKAITTVTVTKSLLTLPHLDINSLIQDIPGFVIIKDLNSNYLNANLNTISEFGLKNADHLFGYSDLTIPHPLSHNGQFYRNLDFEVLQTNQPMKGICTFPFNGDIRPYNFRKSILRDMNGNNIATYSHAEECNNPMLLQFIHNLIVDHPLNNKNNPITTANSFFLNQEYRGIELSPLESNCLFYLIRQKTKTEIAHLLNLPTHIINVCIENIKTQLNVNHLREILDKAIEKEYINIVPPSIFTQLCRIQNHSLASNHQHAVHSEQTLLTIKLTNRELDCAKLLIHGCKIKEIASRIHLSPRTVETHINNLKTKLACRDKVELIIKLRDLIL